MARAPGLTRALRLGEKGATVVEYVLVIMFMAMVCFAPVSAPGTSLTGPYERAINGLS